MHNLLIPTLGLLILPALYAAVRLNLLAYRSVGWIGGAVLLAATVASMPFGGMELPYIKRLNLILASTVCLLMLIRHGGLLASRTRYLTSLLFIAVLAVCSYFNFFAFHGGGVFVHLTDVAHQYLGSKYCAELGYTDLYVAMLRAEAELHDNHFYSIEARDLETYDLVHIRTLLQRSDSVKQSFSAQRWSDFKHDVEYFRDSLGPQYSLILSDHGFNPSPAWTLIGGNVSRWVPAGSARAISLLTLVDPILLCAAALAILWAFGSEAALLAVIHFCVIFGANFAWTGGSFLRFPWLFATVVAFCCLRRRRYLPAGSFFALACTLRIFPALLVLPLLFKMAATAFRDRRLAHRHLRFVSGMLVTASLLMILSGSLPRGWHHWVDFGKNMSLHLRTLSPNLVGMTEILRYQPGAPEQVTAEQFRDLRQRRHLIHRIQLWLVFLPVTIMVAAASRRTNDAGVVLLGMPLIFCALSLGSYYYVFLLLLTAYFHRFPARIALIFAIEAMTHCLGLFEDRLAQLHLYRSVLVGYLMLALFGRALLRDAMQLSGRLMGGSPRLAPDDQNRSPGQG